MSHFSDDEGGLGGIGGRRNLGQRKESNTSQGYPDNMENDFPNIGSQTRDGRQKSVTDDEQLEELLGLDKSIKIVKRRAVVKLDSERLLAAKGLPYIRNNYKRIKLDSKNEIKDMKHIIDFYQLWCHNLFPKANFQDCLSLITKLGDKDPAVKEKRRMYLDTEIRAKVGFGSHNMDDFELSDTDYNNTTSGQRISANANEEERETERETEGINLGASIVTSGNQLFIQEDDEDDNIYGRPSSNTENTDARTFTAPMSQSSVATAQTNHMKSANLVESDDFEFSEVEERELDNLLSQRKPLQNTGSLTRTLISVKDTDNNNEKFQRDDNKEIDETDFDVSSKGVDLDDDFEDEMDIMREMGL